MHIVNKCKKLKLFLGAGVIQIYKHVSEVAGAIGEFTLVTETHLYYLWNKYIVFYPKIIDRCTVSETMKVSDRRALGCFLNRRNRNSGIMSNNVCNGQPAGYNESWFCKFRVRFQADRVLSMTPVVGSWMSFLSDLISMYTATLS